MARPLSDEKRDALLASTTAAVASLGIAASTLSIAKAAGVAEGTLFRYFPTKDELLNALYVELKSDLLSLLVEDLPRAHTQTQFRHLWDRYIDWGTKFPEKHEALRQLEVSHKISDAALNANQAMSRELQNLVETGFASGALRIQPVLFLWGIIQSIASLVLQTFARDESMIDECKDLGWETLWGAIAVN